MVLGPLGLKPFFVLVQHDIVVIFSHDCFRVAETSCQLMQLLNLLQEETEDYQLTTEVLQCLLE